MEPEDSVDVPLDVDRLEGYLKTLASPTRLRILWSLRTPKRPSDVRVPASQQTQDLNEDRLLSRPGVVQHLDRLEEFDLVERLEEEKGRPYVVNHQMLFRILEDLGRIGEVRPTVDVDVEETLEEHAPANEGLPEGPRFVVAGGPRRGEAFELSGQAPWLIGRGPSADVQIEWDPQVSREHARVRKDPETGFEVEVLPEARNPVRVNFEPVDTAQPASLLAGAIVTVGASSLVFQIV